jgi:hypothetical protein
MSYIVILMSFTAIFPSICYGKENGSTHVYKLLNRNHSSCKLQNYANPRQIIELKITPVNLARFHVRLFK